MLINLRPSSYFMGSNVNLGSFQVTEATVSRSVSRSSSLPCRSHRQGLVSYSFLLSSSFFFFFLLSGNTSFSHTSLHPILTKLCQSDRYLNHYSGLENGGVRGHNGVTGVKKVIFTKKTSSPTEYLALMRDLCICISLTPLQKLWS